MTPPKEQRFVATQAEALAFATQQVGSFRRPITPAPNFPAATVQEVLAQFPGESLAAIVNQAYQDGWVEERCPFGEPASSLWVAEEWGYRGQGWSSTRPTERTYYVAFKVDGVRRDVVKPDDWVEEGIPLQPERLPTQSIEDFYGETLTAYWRAWQPAESMPRWACRSRVLVTDVGVSQESGTWMWVVSWRKAEG
jgi:hypothetical protein